MVFKRPPKERKSFLSGRGLFGPRDIFLGEGTILKEPLFFSLVERASPSCWGIYWPGGPFCKATFLKRGKAGAVGFL